MRFGLGREVIARMRAHGIMFHHFHGGQHPASQGSISAERLAALIESGGRDRILSADEWRRRAVAGELYAGDLCLTFDDNLRCQYDIARPVLDHFGLTAFWFVYTCVLEGQLDRLQVYRRFCSLHFGTVAEFYEAFREAVEQSAYAARMERALGNFDPASYLAEFPFYTEADRRFRYVRDDVLGPVGYYAVMDGMMASKGVDAKRLAQGLWMDDECIGQLHRAGHVIGLHSHTHPTRMAQLSREEQGREYRANHAYLTKLLGEPPDTMSHPCNSYNGDTLQVLRELGIRVGFRSNMADVLGGELEYPREDHANLCREIRA